MASSGRSLYQRYIQVISRWPLDPSKEGRDLGTRIRSRVALHFPKGELTQLETRNLQALNKEIEALERITKNVNKNHFSRSVNGFSTATGLTVEQLKRATSTEYLQSLDELNQAGLLARIKLQISSIF